MHSRQQGSTLAISLILLLVFTLLGLSSISNVTFNQKMASNYRDADLAFQAAEAALSEGEAFAESLSVGLIEDYLDEDCAGDDCFTASCSGGKCFNGSYAVQEKCEVENPAVLPAEDESTWTTAGRTRQSEINFPGLKGSPQFIVEFLCYVQADPSTPVTAPTSANNWAYPAADWSYLYRITSYAQGGNNSRAMLQSTYKVTR